MSTVSTPAFVTPSMHGFDGTRWWGLGVVVFVHLAALFFLLRQTPDRAAVRTAPPLTVAIVTPPKVDMPPPPPPPPPPRAPPKPRLEPLETLEPPPLLLAAPTTPTVLEFASPPPAVPAPPAEPDASTAVAAPTVPSPRPAPLAIVPPSFNAAYLRNEPPRYPNASRRTGEQGKVLMRVYVSASGVPEKVELHSSSGFDRLDQAALETVRTWRFVPAHQAGTPVGAWVLVPIAFSLAH